MTHRPALSVIIVNCNTRDLLLNCLAAVERQDLDQPYEVIVVDNASSDGSVAAVRARFPSVKIGEMPENVGFGRANNAGFALSTGEFVLLLNSDTVPEHDVFRLSLNYIRSQPAVGAMGCKLVLSSGRLDHACRRGLPTPWNALAYFSGLGKLFPKWRLVTGYTLSHLDEDQATRVDCLSGAFMLVRREVFEAMGGFDPDYFFYGEDIDLCYRIRQAGWELHYAPVATVLHVRGGSTGKGNTRASQSFYKTMWTFYDKHLRKRYNPVVTAFVRVGLRLMALRPR